MSTLELGVVGNCAIASLIDRRGRHVWHGLGRLDGDPVFNALLGGNDPQGGFMEAAVAGGKEGRQRYLPNSAILETIVEGTSGTLRIVDFAPRFRRFGRMFRPPMLVRRLEPVAGRPRVTLRLRPTFNYGGLKPQVTSGSHHARFVGDNAVLRLTTDGSITYILHETEFGLDRPITLIVGADESITEDPELPGEQLPRRDRDLLAWLGARPQHSLRLAGSGHPRGNHPEALQLRGHRRGAGGPDDVGARGRRDAAHLGLPLLLVARFVLHRERAQPSVGDAHHGRLRALHRRHRRRRQLARRGRPDRPACFPIAPGTDTAERLIDTLPGYRGYGPVRTGNAAVIQRQNDTYGSMVMTAAQMFWDERLPRHGDMELYRQLCVVGNEAHKAALTPDAGLWEYREREEVHTFSAAMCWAAQHRLGMIARRVGADAESREWLARAGVLRQEVLQRATMPEGGWLSGVLDRDMADASSLVLPEIGLLRSDDPRFHATLDVIGKRLMKNGFLMRYVEADDFGKPSNAFLLCTFWYIDALASVGRRDEALELFNNVLGRRNHVGLLSEDIDPKTGELWGNFPQTYSQVGLILSAMRLSRTWEEGLWHAS